MLIIFLFSIHLFIFPLYASHAARDDLERPHHSDDSPRVSLSTSDHPFDSDIEESLAKNLSTLRYIGQFLSLSQNSTGSDEETQRGYSIRSRLTSHRYGFYFECVKAVGGFIAVRRLALKHLDRCPPHTLKIVPTIIALYFLRNAFYHLCEGVEIQSIYDRDSVRASIHNGRVTTSRDVQNFLGLWSTIGRFLEPHIFADIVG